MVNNITTPENLQISVSSTIISGGNITDTKYIIASLNDKNLAIPIHKIELTTPDIDFLTPYTDLIINNATIITSASSYGNVGLGIVIYDNLTPCNSAYENYCIPLYKTSESDAFAALDVKTPTVVTGITQTSAFFVAKINNDSWAIPIYNFNSLYPFTQTIDQQLAVVTTKFETSDTLLDAPREAGSTNLNSKVKTYQDVMKRIKMQMGWPVVQIEICDEAIVEHIDTAIEWYTKYAGYTEEILAFDSRNYECGFGMRIDKMITQLYCMSNCEPQMGNKKAANTNLQKSFYDYDLDSYRKVVDLWSFDEANTGSSDYLFSMEYVFAQQTYFSYVLGNYGFDLVTWHILKEWIDTREKMFALKRRYHFDDRNQILRLYPEPGKNERFIGVVGCYVEKPIKDVIMERWIYQYALALSKITVGNVRGKFTSVTQFGGGTINYSDLLNQGLEEKKQLEDEIMNKHGEVAPIKFFVG